MGITVAGKQVSKTIDLESNPFTIDRHGSSYKTII